MIIENKARWFILAIGTGLSISALVDMRVSSNAAYQPTVFEMADLESGTNPSDNHIQIGEAVLVFQAAEYELLGNVGRDGITPDDKVMEVYFPIISTDHDFAKRTGIAKHLEIDEVSDWQWKTFDRFRVVAKVKDYKTIGSIPRGMKLADSLQGMVVNSIGGIRSTQKNRFRKKYSRANLDDVLVIELGRKPQSYLRSIVVFGLGLFITLGGAVSFIMSRRD